MYKYFGCVFNLLKFVSKVSSMGKNRRIIEIPKDEHREADKLKGKNIKVIVEELKL